MQWRGELYVTRTTGNKDLSIGYRWGVSMCGRAVVASRDWACAYVAQGTDDRRVCQRRYEHIVRYENNDEDRRPTNGVRKGRRI